MQVTSYYRDPYEDYAWRLYLRECAMRTAREELAFLEATGGVTAEDLQRIRRQVQEEAVIKQDEPVIKQEADLKGQPEGNHVTISLKSILADVVQHDGVNHLCRRLKPMLDDAGITTLKKHNAVHVLKADAQRVRDLVSGCI